jgi:hypothetical protein
MNVLFVNLDPKANLILTTLDDFTGLRICSKTLQAHRCGFEKEYDVIVNADDS